MYLVILLWAIGIQTVLPLAAQDRTLTESRSTEYRLSQTQEFRGSHLVMRQRENESEPLFFEFKSRAYGVAASDVVSVWQGMERRRLRRTSLGGASIYAAVGLRDSTCAIVFERADTLYLAEIGASLQCLRTLALPLTATTGTLTHTALLATLSAEAQSGGAMVRLLALADGETLALDIGNRLFWADWRNNAPDSARIRLLENYTLSDLVPLNPYTRDENDPACALLRESGLRKDVIMLSVRGKALWEQSLDVQQRTILRRVSNYTVAACTERGATTYIHILKMGEPPMTTGLAAKIECIAFAEEPGRVSAFAVVNDNSNGRYVWTAVRLPFDGGKSFSDENLWTFPENVIAPLAVTVSDDEFFCLFSNALVLMGFGGEALATSRTNGTFRLAQYPTLHGEVATTRTRDRNLYLLRLGRDNVLFARDAVPLWWLRNFVRDFWLFAVLISIVGIGASLLTIVRYQRRLLTTLFGVPGADVMLILDTEGKLLSLNNSARTLLGIALEAPMRRLFQFYCVDDATRTLSNFAREAGKNRRSMQTTITFRKAAPDAFEGVEPHDYLFSAVPIQTRFGSARGTMFIGKDITEELGKKKLGNWSQLGHDLQTNLAAIRLNAEKIAESGSPEGKSIVYQARLVQQRIKDIITVGKNEQMDMKQANAAEICLNVCREFDKTLYPNVAFQIEAQHILFQCAQPQFERALRNAVENGIKRGLEDNRGIITLTVLFHADVGEVRFSVRDNGRGMSAETLRQMMNRGFTMFESKGGSGLGTMIMQYIVKAHHGTMHVESEEGKGTTVEFRLPGKGARVLPQKPLRILPGEMLEGQ